MKKGVIPIELDDENCEELHYLAKMLEVTTNEAQKILVDMFYASVGNFEFEMFKNIKRREK